MGEGLRFLKKDELALSPETCTFSNIFQHSILYFKMIREFKVFNPFWVVSNEPCRKVLQERPYITEAGPQVYTRLCVLLCSPYSDIDMVTEKHVLWQCQYVLIGIPTSIFQFDKVGNYRHRAFLPASQVEICFIRKVEMHLLDVSSFRILKFMRQLIFYYTLVCSRVCMFVKFSPQTKVEFVPLQNICYTGVSPDSLADCLYSIAYSGTLFLRLKMFCDQYSTVERYGNVVKGLVSAVERYLFLHQVFLSKVKILDCFVQTLISPTAISL